MKSIITVASEPGIGTCKIIREAFPDAVIINCATVFSEELTSIDFNEKVVIFEEIDRAPLTTLNFIRRLYDKHGKYTAGL
jgi:hypothetical protein